jgi:hypothetical protein
MAGPHHFHAAPAPVINFDTAPDPTLHIFEVIYLHLIYLIILAGVMSVDKLRL